MHVSRIGLTPLKGARHADLPRVDLTADGPVGDRVFCLVDPARGRVVRTLENPTLMRTTAGWDGETLTATLPGPAGGRTVSGVPADTGERLDVDYWGRRASVLVVDGPWGAAYSAHLGYDVVLARSAAPGEVVYGAGVSLVTTSSVDRLARECGAEVDPAQFRATFTIDTTGLPQHVEDSWLGSRLHLGEAEVEVRSAIPRCAVVDLDPETGARRSRVLRALGSYRQASGEVVFGVDAVVTVAGRVLVGDAVEGG